MQEQVRSMMGGEGTSRGVSALFLEQVPAGEGRDGGSRAHACRAIAGPLGRHQGAQVPRLGPRAAAARRRGGAHGGGPRTGRRRDLHRGRPHHGERGQEEGEEEEEEGCACVAGPSSCAVGSRPLFDLLPRPPRSPQVERIIASREHEEQPSDAADAAGAATPGGDSAAAAPRRGRLYLVKWRGMPYREATWEHAEDIKDVRRRRGGRRRAGGIKDLRLRRAGEAATVPLRSPCHAAAAAAGHEDRRL